MVGQTLLHYRILRPLGQGGMGEVYLAEDTRLKRQVALKMLPAALRSDPDRLRRFRNEAEAAARLKHPNIATIFALEETRDILFITMEYVDGRPLHELIPGDGVPTDQFFSWFLPITDALCHAHSQGVYHRDMKPGNVMILADGTPKILDFGLARIERELPLTDAAAEAINSLEPTRSLSEVGTVLGTPAYMSPEQAIGKRGDQQSDIFSFGVMMYEALSGKRPFTGEHYVSIISSILKDEPTPVTAWKPDLPYTLGRIVRHCLQKDLNVRYKTMLDIYRDLKDARSEYENHVVVGVGQKTTGPLIWQRPLPLAGAATLLFLIVMATWWVAQQQNTESASPLRKFQMPLDNMEQGGPALSPDGSMIAYIHSNRLWIRRLDQAEGREIPETEGAAELFWSPKSDQVGYRIASTLWKVAPDGGSRTRLCELPRRRLMGITWGAQGTITLSLSNPNTAELWSVSDRGGDIQPLVMPDTDEKEWGAVTPHYLPDGRTLVYAVWTRGDLVAVATLAERYRRDQTLQFYISVAQIASSYIVVHSPDTGRRRLPLTGEFLSVAAYAPTPTGHLLYYRGASPGQGNLWAVPFSSSAGMVTGEPFPVVQEANAVSVSADGTLAYRSSTRPQQQLAWVDRRGRIDGTIGQPQEVISDPALSPDGSRVVVEGVEDGIQDLWMHEVERGIKTRLTFIRQNASGPVWSPDGKRILFENDTRVRFRQGGFFTVAADGGDTPRPITADSLTGSDPRWSRDGRYLVYGNRGNLAYVDFRGDQNPVSFLQSRVYTGNPALSADNRYLAYESNESGRMEVYVTRFPSGEGKWQVSVDGGAAPKWNAQGDEIFYINEERLMAAPVIETPVGFRVGRPEQVFEGRQVRAMRLWFSGYDVSPDGQRFIVVQNVGESLPMLTIVENWIREFEKQESTTPD